MSFTFPAYILLLENNDITIFTEQMPYLDTKNSIWEISNEENLGGFFYDRIYDMNNQIWGVRYWLMEGSFADHPVWRRFVNDKRFIFYDKNAYVDIMFNTDHNVRYNMNTLTVNDSQDFGGDALIKSFGLMGIAFSFENIL